MCIPECGLENSTSLIKSAIRIPQSAIQQMPASISEYTPQIVLDEGSARAPRRSAWWAWGFVLAGAASLVGMIVLAPLARARGSLLLSQVFYQFFRAACHQMPERS